MWQLLTGTPPLGFAGFCLEPRSLRRDFHRLPLPLGQDITAKHGGPSCTGSALELRCMTATTIPDVEDLDGLVHVVDLEVHMTPRLRHEQPLQRRTLRSRKRCARSGRRLEPLDSSEKLSREDARSISLLAPASIDSLGCASRAFREPRFHDLATSR